MLLITNNNTNTNTTNLINLISIISNATSKLVAENQEFYNNIISNINNKTNCNDFNNCS